MEVQAPRAMAPPVRPLCGWTHCQGGLSPPSPRTHQGAGPSGACVLAVGSPFPGAVALERHVFGAVSGQTLGCT